MNELLRDVYRRVNRAERDPTIDTFKEIRRGLFILQEQALKRKKSDMEVKELVELLQEYNQNCNTQDGFLNYIQLFDDASGCLYNDQTRRELFEFNGVDGLVRKLQEKQKTPDYKSLFSVVDGLLVADFSGISITKENCLPLSWTKWIVRGEEMNVAGKIIYTYKSDEGRTCACCILYNDCVGCPIVEYTGVLNCRGTPFDDFVEAAEANDLFAAMIANKKEEKFLKSLMEK